MISIIELLTPKKMTYFIKHDATIRQALEQFDVHKFNVVPIIDEEGRYCGTLSEGDLLRFIKNQESFNLKKAELILVREIDHYRPYKCLKIDADINEVFALSLEQNFIPIVDDRDKYIGIIKRKEIINALFQH